MRRISSDLILVGSSLFALLVFAGPILVQGKANTMPAIAGLFSDIGQNSALLTIIVLSMILVVMLLEIQGEAINVKLVAALGVLVALTSILRFVETAVPGPGGFSPIFVPIILSGYVFGARFGFVMGSLSMLTSALITGGVGPWLPQQMLVAGWVGMTAGLLPKLPERQGQTVLLVAFGFIWGILYGVMLTLFFWPFFMGQGMVNQLVSSNVWDTIRQFGAFYLGTSGLWDLGRAVGNAVILIALGPALTRAMNRFAARFQFQRL